MIESQDDNNNVCSKNNWCVTIPKEQNLQYVHLSKLPYLVRKAHHYQTWHESKLQIKHAYNAKQTQVYKSHVSIQTQCKRYKSLNVYSRAWEPWQLPCAEGTHQWGQKYQRSVYIVCMYILSCSGQAAVRLLSGQVRTPWPDNLTAGLTYMANSNAHTHICIYTW